MFQPDHQIKSFRLCKCKTSVKQIGVLLMVLLNTLFFPIAVKSAAESTQEDRFSSVSVGGANVSNGINCFDYYKFNSVGVKLHSENSVYQTGDQIKFSGIIKNNNNYPIVSGNLFVQVLRDNSGQSLKYGNDLIDEFFALENIALGAKGEKLAEFFWKVPQGLSQSRYILASYFIVDKKMNVSGLSFADNIYGGVTYFELGQEKEVSEVVFDRSNIFLNGEQFVSRTFTPQIENEREITIKYNLRNLSSESKDLKLSKKLYKWDNLIESQMITQSEEQIALAAKAKTVSTAFENLKPGIYLFEATAQNSELKSILKIRFAVVGEGSNGRLNFSGLEKFPLKKDQTNYIFTCFHSMMDNNNFEGKVKMNLKDKNDRIIASEEYSGLITPQIMAIKKEFIPDNDYEELWLDSLVYDKENKLIDQTTLPYSCASFDDSVKMSVAVKNGVLEVGALNVCGKPVTTQISAEVETAGGRMVYFEPLFKGAQLKKKIDFLPGLTYKIQAVTAGISETISYVHPADTLPAVASKSFSWLAAGLALLLAIILALVIIKIVASKQRVNKKNNQNKKV